MERFWTQWKMEFDVWMNKPRHHTLGAILLLQSARPECSVCDYLKWREESCCSRCTSTLLITSGTFYCYGVTFNPVTYPSLNQNASLQPEFLCGTHWLSHLFLNLYFFLFFCSKTFLFTIGPDFSEKVNSSTIKFYYLYIFFFYIGIRNSHSSSPIFLDNCFYSLFHKYFQPLSLSSPNFTFLPDLFGTSPGFKSTHSEHLSVSGSGWKGDEVC